MASITAIYVPHLMRAAIRLGGDPVAIAGEHAHRTNVPYEDRIALDAYVGIWERAVDATGHRDLPARAVQFAVQDEHGLIGFLVANLPRLGDGIDAFQRYGSTNSDAYRWQFVDDGRVIRCLVSPTGPVHRRGWQYHLEYDALDVIRAAARLTGGAARPTALRFLHAAPAPDVVAAITDAGGIAPEFGCERCEISFPSTIRDLPVAAAVPALATVVEARLEAMLAAIESGRSVSARVRAAIGPLLATEAGGVGELARSLAMSRRSLERALADEGTSAGELLDEERKQRALAWLPVMSVEQVALRLGYSDARAFARAFKRWTGVPPSASRR